MVPRLFVRAEILQDAIEKRLALWGDVLFVEIGEATKQFFLLGTNLLRNFHISLNEQVASLPGAGIGHSEAAHSEQFAALRASWNVDGLWAVQARNLDRCSEHRLAVTQWDLND